MKILFVDLDGVLNSKRYFDSKVWQERPKKSREDWKLASIDDTKIPLLNRITDATGARIVISSS